MTDQVTGASAEVELLLDLHPEQLWELITDVGRIGEWSPETVRAGWVRRQAGSVCAGDRFEAHNVYPGGFEAEVVCVVSEAAHARVFEYGVLDDDLDPARPGSIWRYELAAEGTGTRVRQRFTHGPGLTGLREGVLARPEQAEAVLQGRLGRLRQNMEITLRAMAGAAQRSAE